MRGSRKSSSVALESRNNIFSFVMMFTRSNHVPWPLRNSKKIEKRRRRRRRYSLITASQLYSLKHAMAIVIIGQPVMKPIQAYCKL
jgi:hypothetical protein